MALTLEQEFAILKAEVARLAQHNQELLNTRNKLAYAATNEIAARHYPQRRIIDKWETGVTVFKKNQRIEQQQKIDVGYENRLKIERVLRDGDPIEWERGVLYITGEIATNNVPIDIRGLGDNTIITQMLDSPTFRFICNPSKKITVQIQGFSMEPGVQISPNHFAIYVKPNTMGGDTSGYIRDIVIRRSNDLEYDFGGGLMINNPNEMDISGIRVLGKFYLFSDAPTIADPLPATLPFLLGQTRGESWNTTGIAIRGNKANISFSLERCKVYDYAKGFDIFSTTAPGLEGIYLSKCDAVGVAQGFRIESTYDNTSYLPPQIDMIGCHANILNRDGGRCFFVRNYAQVNITNCSAYADGSTEKQYGFDLNTISEANITNCRAYRNQPKEENTKLFTGIRFGPNCILNRVIGLTSYVGKPNQIYEFTTTSSRNDCWKGNDESKPDSYVLDNGVDNNVYNQRLYGGVIDNQLVSAFWPSWKTRTQDEDLRITRYPSDHPLYPNKLSVESYQHTLDAYTTADGPSTLYWKIWESQDITSAGNRDYVHFTAQFGRWNAFASDVARQQVEIILSTRQTPNVIWQNRGALSTSAILIKQHEGKVSIWLCLAGPSGELQSGSITPIAVLAETQFTRRLWAPDVNTEYYDSKTGSIGITTVPSGTTLLDTRTPQTYKPVSWEQFDSIQLFVRATTTAPTTLTLLPGFSRTIYDSDKQELVTYYHDNTDSVTPIKVSMRKPVPVTSYSAFIADRDGGVTKFPLWNTRDQRYEYVDIATARDWMSLNWLYQKSWDEVYELLDTRYVKK